MIAGRDSGPLLLIATLLLWLPTAAWAGDLPRRGTLGLELDPQMVRDCLLISHVEADGSAEEAGLRPGDRIQRVDGEGFRSADELRRLVGRHREGETVRLRVGRELVELDLVLVVDPLPRESAEGLHLEYGSFRTGGADGPRLRSLALRPETVDSPLPALLILPPGIGQACDDVGPNPARELSRALAREGVLVFRYDPRGRGDSEGEEGEAGMESEVADAHAALQQLRARPDVDPERVAIFAQGEASRTAAHLADANPAVAGVALWAPMVRPVLEWLLVSTRQQQEIGDVPEDRAAMFIDALGQSLGLILAGVEGEEVRTRVPVARPLWDQRGRFLGRSPARWREMNDRALLEAWPRVRGPILVMRGGLDVQNPPGESDILLRVLDEGKHPSHRAVVLPGLDGDMGAASSELEALRRLAAGDRGAEGADRVARLLRAWLDSPENSPDALLKASPTENDKGEVP